MGYIDKEKMLHDISVKMGECLLNDSFLQYGVWDGMNDYVSEFPEVRDPFEVIWLKEGEHCLVRIDGKFYEARRSTIKDPTNTEYLEVHFQIDREPKTEVDDNEKRPLRITRAMRFKEAREATGLSQRDVSAQTFIACSTIKTLESEDYSDPKYYTVAKLADFYGVELRWLMEGDDADIR